MRSDVQERFAAAPSGFLFTIPDVRGCDREPRVKHCMSLLDYAEANLLACYARAEQKLDVASVVLMDKSVVEPVCVPELN